MTTLLDTHRDVDQPLAKLVDEITLRLQAGQPVELEDYATEYPNQIEQLRGLLPALQVLAGIGQGAVLGHPSPLGVPGGETSERERNDEGGVLGDYRIRREIGRGGMGVVYEAEQISLGRRVALKVLPFTAVLDPKQLQRFKNEAQAAAHLQHPHIVGVYSVGVERGVHYYAMEFIEGANLGELIEQLRQPSELGADDSEEEGDANRRLARDLTTGRLGAQAPTPRFDDPTSSDPIAGPPITRSGNETPPDVEAVISPGSGSTRSREFFRSVAQLGIQAAEALDHAHQLGVVHRDIKPSNLLVDSQGHLWVTDFGLALTSTNGNLTMTGDVVGTLRYMSPEQVSGRRTRLDYHTDVYSLGLTLWELLTLTPVYPQEDRPQLLRQILDGEPRRPRQLNPAIPKDLETIILKATAKEPHGRYATAQALADDLQRFLEDKPIHAKRPAAPARVAKWARRHRAVVWSTVALLMALLIGSAVSTALIWAEKKRTDDALKQAEQNAAESNAVVDFLVNDLLGATEPNRTKGRNVTVKEVLDQAEVEIDTAFKDQPLVEASVRSALGKACDAIGRYKKAEQHHGRALELRKAALGPEHPATLQSMNNLANVLRAQGQLTEARKLHEETLELTRRILGLEHRFTLMSMNNLANVLFQHGELEEARKLYEKTLELQRRILGSEHPDALMSMNNLANVLFEQGELEEARKLYEKTLELQRRILGSEHPATLRSMDNLANLLRARGQITRPRNLLEEALELRRHILGPEHPDTLRSMNNLANVLRSQGRFEEARKMYEETLELRRRILGPRHPDTLGSVIGMVSCSEVHELHDAKTYFDEILESELDGYGTSDISSLFVDRGRISWYLEDFENALADFEEAIQVDPENFYAHKWLCWALATCPEIEFRDAHRAIEMGEISVKLKPSYYDSSIALGLAHYLAGDLSAAVSALNKGLELKSGGDAWAGFYMAMAQWQLDKKDEARQWHQKATDWMSREGPLYRAELRRFRDQAAELLGITDSPPTGQTEKAQAPGSNQNGENTGA